MSSEQVTDIACVEQQEAVTNREAFERNIINMWGYSTVGLEAKRAAMTMLRTKTGMYAKVPIVCKGDSCPYHDSCALLPYNLAPQGEFCPIETAQIELRVTGYDQDFDLEGSSFTDRCLVSEIVNCDVMLERTKALMAKEGIPVVDVCIGVNEQGDEIMQPQVSKFLEAYDRIQKRRNELYDLMMATRKNKKEKEGNEEKSITELIAEATTDGSFTQIEQRPEGLKG